MKGYGSDKTKDHLQMCCGSVTVLVKATAQVFFSSGYRSCECLFSDGHKSPKKPGLSDHSNIVDASHSALEIEERMTDLDNPRYYS